MANIMAEGEEWRGFYNQHRGGKGNVIMCIVAEPGDAIPSKFAIFSCIETAEEWAATLSDEHQVCFAPFVIDEPNFGNTTKQ